jgi:hypothetical protein
VRSHFGSQVDCTALARHAPFLFIDFDGHGDATAVRHALADRRIGLVLVLGDLRGTALRFETANGDLIPAMDLYAEQSGTRHEVTRQTAVAERMAGLAPFPATKTIVIHPGRLVPSGDAQARTNGSPSFRSMRHAATPLDLPMRLERTLGGRGFRFTARLDFVSACPPHGKESRARTHLNNRIRRTNA